MKKHLPWLAAATIIVVAFGTIYVVTQQSIRSNANATSLLLASSAARQLDTGVTPAQLVKTTRKVDAQKTIQPFVVVYDKSGKVLAYTGYLNGHGPQIPVGVLKASDGKPYHAVTWEPEKGVRLASVTVASKQYYVVGAQTLRNAEKSEAMALGFSALGCALALGVLAVAYFVLSRRVFGSK